MLLVSLCNSHGICKQLTDVCGRQHISRGDISVLPQKVSPHWPPNVTGEEKSWPDRFLNTGPLAYSVCTLSTDIEPLDGPLTIPYAYVNTQESYPKVFNIRNT